MAYETITVDVDNHIALVTLNRPDALNALNDQLMTELADALKSAQENEKVRCIVITGSEKAFAAGADIAMMCDFIICSETAKFGQPEINLGVVAGIGGTQRLTRAIGKSKAMDMNLTGRFMDAAEAERSGLVSRVVPVKKLMEEAMAAAAKIAEKSLISTMVVKEAVNRSFEVPLREGLLFERRVFHSLFATEDQKEGMSAFLEKREAQFRDK